MRKLLLKNKRGVSEMVGYVLLIVIAIGISVLVYTYLKDYIPKDNPSCGDDVHLALKNFSCSITVNAGKPNLVLVLENKGLFTVKQAYIRLAPKGNLPVYITDSRSRALSNGLLPGQSIIMAYGSTNSQVSRGLATAGEYVLEIEPAIYVENWRDPVLCDKSTIQETISCY